MGEITLLTGGARSGKSRHAQQFAQEYRDVAYIATAINTDAEMQSRIMMHRQGRPHDWVTYECPYEIVPTLCAHRHEVYLIDCMTVFVSNLIFQQKSDWQPDEVLNWETQSMIEKEIEEKILDLLQFMAKSNAKFIIVTNEVGMGVVPDTALGRFFRDLAGRMNQLFAQQATRAYFTVSGMLMQVKGEK